jgi:threonine synthase
MLYYSLNNPSLKCNFKEATLRGQAQDKGLFFPQSIPVLPKSFIKHIESYTKEDIAYTVVHPYVGDTIPERALGDIIHETINFPFPLIPVNNGIYSLELFHGPTLAFKDVGARFMSRCLGHFTRGNDKKITVLVATSGDTGGAVADGFYDVDGVQVTILYPSGKVSNVQERQLTTRGKNITSLEVEGTFDDCQQLVKQAFADSELNKELFLTSANSINVARWLPQQLYYFFAWQQWEEKHLLPVISVPSGNFGNICAGLLAYKSGLPAEHFIAACNANDTIPQYLISGNYRPRTARATLSNAMDVGDPSNFVRILELFKNSFPSIKKVLSSYSINDAKTLATIEQVYKEYGYIVDPHGAVGYACLQMFLGQSSSLKGYFLETAHPIKFHETVKAVIDQDILVDSIERLMQKEKKAIKIPANYTSLRDCLLASR